MDKTREGLTLTKHDCMKETVSVKHTRNTQQCNYHYFESKSNIKKNIKNEADKPCVTCLLTIIFALRKMAKIDHCAFLFGSTVRPESLA